MMTGFRNSCVGPGQKRDLNTDDYHSDAGSGRNVCRTADR